MASVAWRRASQSSIGFAAQESRAAEECFKSHMPDEHTLQDPSIVDQSMVIRPVALRLQSDSKLQAASQERDVKVKIC